MAATEMSFPVSLRELNDKATSRNPGPVLLIHVAMAENAVT